MSKEEKVDYKRENTTFPVLMHRHKFKDGTYSIIQADPTVFPEWIFEVEKRIEDIEQKLKIKGAKK